MPKFTPGPESRTREPPETPYAFFVSVSFVMGDRGAAVRHPHLSKLGQQHHASAAVPRMQPSHNPHANHHYPRAGGRYNTGICRASRDDHLGCCKIHAAEGRAPQLAPNCRGGAENAATTTTPGKGANLNVVVDY